MTIKCLAATQVGGELQEFSYEPAELSPLDIELAISHCGVCHTDIHMIENEDEGSTYPLVPGHEIVGVITQKGSEVQDLEIGQRVGVGFQRSTCLECDSCTRGDEQFCPDLQETCRGHYGGYADAIRTDSRFAFPIPKALSSENAATLLCAGITVYSPLRHFEIQPGQRVGVIGIGGLGHLALQFARAWGCVVTAFSSSADKEGEAREFGAHHFASSVDASALEKADLGQDLILSTVHKGLDWEAYVNLLRPYGRLCFVGAIFDKPIQISALSLIWGNKSVCGSLLGNRSCMREMFDFAARHGIEAKTEVVPMSEANAAIQKVRSNRARYRMVLGNSVDPAGN